MGAIRNFFINIFVKNREEFVKEVAAIEILFQEEKKKYDDAIYKNKKETSEYNKICPNCKKKSATDKIIPTTRYVTDGFSPFFGERGHQESDSKTINHCSECGHEWKKYDMWDDSSFTYEEHIARRIGKAFGESEFFLRNIVPYKNFNPNCLYSALVDKHKVKVSLHQIKDALSILKERIK